MDGRMDEWMNYDMTNGPKQNNSIHDPCNNNSSNYA